MQINSTRDAPLVPDKTSVGGDDGQRRGLLSLIRNPISLFGGMLVATGFGAMVFFIALQILEVESSPYIGMLVYTGLPMVLIAGMGIVPLGMAWEARRRAIAIRRGQGAPMALHLDFGNPRHLLGILAFATISAVVVGGLGATGLRAIEFMETPMFCGQLCHTVMRPQYEPYERSAHAEVHCTECHIGPGTSWYVKSKISGMRQMLAVALDTFPRPVPSPIEHLRPARAICEGCHWREKAYGMFLQVYRSYLPDEENSLHIRALAFRVGTGGGELEEAGGVHWHTSAQLYYETTDWTRQTVARVRVEKEEGVEHWVNPNVELGHDVELEEERLMDCIDCHNRAAHKIPDPGSLIDEAFTEGRMDPDIPFLKREALVLLGGDQSFSQPEELAARWAQPGWFEQLTEFYQTNYPEIAVTRGAAIQEAIEEMKRISELVFYQDMRTTWLTHVDNLGHPIVEGQNTGCFRCHATLVRADDPEELLPGGVGGSGCLSCHGLGEEGAERLGGDPVDEPQCKYCHVRIPLEDLARGVDILD